jgi:hypothetical protein
MKMSQSTLSTFTLVPIMSFPNLKVNDGAEWAKWETMIYHFLDKGHICTLDVMSSVLKAC